MPSSFPTELGREVGKRRVRREVPHPLCLSLCFSFPQSHVKKGSVRCITPRCFPVQPHGPIPWPFPYHTAFHHPRFALSPPPPVNPRALVRPGPAGGGTITKPLGNLKGTVGTGKKLLQLGEWDSPPLNKQEESMGSSHTDSWQGTITARLALRALAGR